MAKVKSKWICQNCGYETAGYLGKCPECGSWGSFTEEIQTNLKPQNISPQGIANDTKPSLISDIHIGEEVRVSTNISEFDRILGGGLVQGSLVLIAGDPGIGKSTILLQTSGQLAKNGQKILYVSAEESASQLKLRANRLNIQSDNLYVYPQTNLESIRQQIEEIKPDTIVIDSIQAIYSQSITSSAGSVSQIRECCNILMQIAKTQNITIIIIGHVTKDGNIAGPKSLEHMVDTVLYFEGDRHDSLRLLRSVKNRFGSTNEIGIFEMCRDGMKEVENPAGLFVSGGNDIGCAVTCIMEGNRPILVEIQSLLSTSAFANARRMAAGMDTNRLMLLLAVLERRGGLRVSDKDVYTNAVGGIRIDDRGADLAITLAVAGSIFDRPLPEGTVVIGEIGLTGEIRPVDRLYNRVAECARLGYRRAIVPFIPSLKNFDGIEVHFVKYLRDAFLLLGEADANSR